MIDSAMLDRILIQCGAHDNITIAKAIWREAQADAQATIAELETDLRFVERWANHHAAHPNVSAKEALGVIQHYPAIMAITKGYEDGVVPDTFDPYAKIAELERQLTEAVAAEKERCAVVCEEFGEEWMCGSDELAKIIRQGASND